jgi:hypothetical protein
MRRHLLPLAIVWLCLARATLAGDGGYKVIVHPENPATAVDRDFLRDAYLKRAGDWSTGETIRPVDLPASFPARQRFTRDVLRKTPAQLTTYWNQQIFSGKAVPPPEAESPADVISYVLANRGAVGYVPANVDPGRAKVIEVR